MSAPVSKPRLSHPFRVLVNPDPSAAIERAESRRRRENEYKVYAARNRWYDDDLPPAASAAVRIAR